MSDPNYSSHLNQACSRNHNVNFNYVWDQSNTHWTPMGQNPYDLILNQAKSSIHKFGSNPSLDNGKNDEATIWDGANLYTFPDDAGETMQIKSLDDTDSQEIVVMGLDENFEEKLEFTLKPAFAVPNQTFPALSSINVVILFPGIEAWSVSSCKRLT